MSEEVNLFERKYLAELLGTLLLVFIGCGSAVVAGYAIGYLGIALAFGFVLLVLVYVIGPISGCHVNPAVTIAMLVSKKIEQKDAIMYILHQCVGAIIGAMLLFLIMTGQPDYELAANGLGQNGFGDYSPMEFSMVSVFIAEVILTFIFILVIFGATSDKAPKSLSGLVTGFALTAVYIVGMPISGASVNPARSLGPALIAAMESTAALEQVWLFWIAPIIGAIIAAFVWKEVFCKK